ncbi:MAG: enoyl-CoA hydratase-related protein [Desulfovibrionaceae bacterium]|nr:enoyl-CoA hydratase-related protein [Desulfovibrionaceae bacterium]
MSFVKVDVQDFIATVTYDRPPANATCGEAYIELRDTFYALDAREDIKAVILTSAGKIFMAGNDLGEFSEFYERGSCTAYYDIILNAYMSVKNCRYPVIGAVNGAAAGAGCAFAGCCDVLVAVQGAKFMLSEIKVGIIGADGFASLMVPEKVLRYMAFSGNPLTAEQIHHYGGIHKVVPREALLDEAQALAREFAANSRRALMLWKRCLNENYDRQLPQKFANNLRCTVEFQAYPDFREASAAFIEKRETRFDNA